MKSAAARRDDALYDAFSVYGKESDKNGERLHLGAWNGRKGLESVSAMIERIDRGASE
jgi:hypothetical protein